MCPGGRQRDADAVRTVVELVWLVLAGIWLAAAYALAGLVCSLTGTTSRYVEPAFTMAGYVLWPFDRVLAERVAAERGLGSAPWVVTAGWWLTAVHVVVAVLLALSVVGLPLAALSLTLLPAALDPSEVTVEPLRRPIWGRVVA